jgi:phospholipase C
MALCVLAACGPAPTAHLPSPSPAHPNTPAPQSSPSLGTQAAGQHVFVIVMENRSYDQAIKGGYTAELAKQYAVATNYHGVSHPSLPNYLALTSGSTWGIADDGWHSLPAGGLGAQLTSAGIQWRAYMEGMSGTCTRSGYPYALKHNPFPYFGGSCPSQVVPFSQFDQDMAAATVPNFVWITPDLCHDGHDCSTGTADKWLSQTVPKILATSAWKNGGVLVITWDEGEDSANHVLTLVIHPGTIIRTSDRTYDHYSLLASIEDRFGLSRLGEAANASAMNDLMMAMPRLGQLGG